LQNDLNNKNFDALKDKGISIEEIENLSAAN